MKWIRTDCLRLSICLPAVIAVMTTIAASQVDTEAKVSSAPPVTIPESVFAVGVGGKLVYSISVNKTGKVTNVRLLAGPAWLCGGSEPKEQVREVTRIVTESLTAATFSPRIRRGKPDDAELQLSYVIKRPDEPSPEASDDRVIKKINAGIVNGKAKSLPKPPYPPEARANRASGSVGVEVQVDLDGKVQSAGAVYGHPDLQRAAREAACLARFSPTLLNKEPVEVTGVMVYNFIP